MGALSMVLKFQGYARATENHLQPLKFFDLIYIHIQITDQFGHILK